MDPDDDYDIYLLYCLPDDPDEWRPYCDDEMSSYPIETDIDGAGDRVSHEYR
jgi:hypothetical protein